MNGASAEPAVSVMMPLISSRIRKIGSSQSFFRSRMNCQNSRKNSIIVSSELLLDVTSAVGMRLDVGPVRLAPSGRDRRAPEQPHHHADGRDDEKEYQRQDDARIDPGQHFAEAHPG